ncbi:MAG: FAD-dependent oxidoreductase [Planctomycetota bacterium]|jgi:heterodisulfide reductase subunit A
MGEAPRVGVFVCACGKNIAGSVDVEAVNEYAKTLPGVVASYLNRYTCSEPGQVEIEKAIKEDKLERAVIASCTPLMHEPTFRACVARAGMNPYLMEMANLREHCSWVHSNDWDGATEKAKTLVRSAVARALLLDPQEEAQVPVTPGAVVIGGGVAGIQAALDLAGAGHKVTLVEREPSIGGVMAALDKTFPTMDCSI